VTVILAATMAKAEQAARERGIHHRDAFSLRTFSRVRGLNLRHVVAVGLSPCDVATWLEHPSVIPAWIAEDCLTVEFAQ
jgi:hypothetical protein